MLRRPPEPDSRRGGRGTPAEPPATPAADPYRRTVTDHPWRPPPCLEAGDIKEPRQTSCDATLSVYRVHRNCLNSCNRRYQSYTSAYWYNPHVRTYRHLGEEWGFGGLCWVVAATRTQEVVSAHLGCASPRLCFAATWHRLETGSAWKQIPTGNRLPSSQVEESPNGNQRPLGP